MPTADEAFAAGEDRSDAPPVVRAAFWVWIAAGAIAVAGAVLFFSLRDRLVEETLRQQPKLTKVDLDAAATGLAWWLLLGSVMFLGLIILLAYKARGGTRKARTLLVVVGAISALFQYTIGRVGLLGLVSALLTIVAAGMLFMPTARKFFAVSDER
jgi:hypothetical protein